MSARLDRRRDVELYARYDEAVGRALSALPDGALVLDVGGGRTCSFASRIPSDRDLRIVAVDSSADELSANTNVTSTVVADVSRHIPFENGEVDLLVSRTLLEHVPDLQSTVTEMARVLKPGGRSIHLLPCRYALFAIAARVVPFDIAKRILHTIIPESEGVVEFDVVYDRGHPTALEAAFARAHFHEVNVECTWDQTDYFQPFVPAFLLVLAYQRFAAAFRIRIVAAYALVEAVR